MIKLIYRISLFSILILMSSCQDYLDRVPDSSLNVKIDSEEKISELLTGAYPQASYFSFLEARTDNVAERTNGIHSKLNEQMYKWDDFYDTEDLDSPLNYWNSCYAGIAHANQALELLAKFPKTDRVKALYGEAFLLRAYFHFMLVNIWAEPYKGEKSKQDMGIPYVTSPEKNALVKYSRGTVYDVYQKIEEDLKLGVSLVNDNYYKNPKFHFNKQAAYAFASRFYLMKGDWDLVIQYSNYVLGANPKSTLRNWTEYRRIFLDNAKLLYQKYTNKEEKSNLMLTTTESRIARELALEKYGLTLNLAIKIYGSSSPYHPMAASKEPIYDGLYISKFDEFSLFGNNGGTKPKGLFVTNVLFTTDEVYLNRMEAYAMQKNYNKVELDLRDYLNTKFSLEVEDMLKYSSTNSSQYYNYSPFYGLTIKQLAYVKSITEFRRQEFLHEGLRWFDIRRFYTPINRTSNPLQRDDFRKVMQIPIEAINNGIPANPR